MSGQGRSHRVGECFSVLEQQLIMYLYCSGPAYRAQHEKDGNVQRCQQLNIIFMVRERKCRGGSDQASDLSLT